MTFVWQKPPVWTLCEKPPYSPTKTSSNNNPRGGVYCHNSFKNDIMAYVSSSSTNISPQAPEKISKMRYECTLLLLFHRIGQFSNLCDNVTNLSKTAALFGVSVQVKPSECRLCTGSVTSLCAGGQWRLEDVIRCCF